MASGQESREELERMAEEGQTVVPGGTGGRQDPRGAGAPRRRFVTYYGRHLLLRK